MFEAIEERAARLAERAARTRGEALAERLAAEAPSGVEVTAVEEGVRLSGRGLSRRAVRDPAVRALFGSLR
jgi:hypothetical protein